MTHSPLLLQLFVILGTARLLGLVLRCSRCSPVVAAAQPDGKAV